MTSLTEGQLPTTPAAIASFPSTELASGTGYVQYYGSTGASGAHIVTTTPVYSEDIHTHNVVTSTTSFSKLFDFDWDITYNLPRYVKGWIYLNFPLGTHEALRPYDRYWYAKGEAFHYDGTTETSLGSGTSRIFFTQNNEGVIDSEMCQIKIDATAGKHFKRGEILRFTIQGYMKNITTQSGGISFGVGCDPQNRTDVTWDVDGNAANDSQQIIETDQPTIMIFNVPYRSGV